MNSKMAGWVMILSVVSLAWAHEHPMPAASSKEFNFVKQLAGHWKGTADHMGSGQKAEPVETDFKVTSMGSAVLERLMPNTDGEMIDMYSDEGGTLTMVHYCAMGNQPHMRLKSAGANKVSLEMGPTSGINVAKDVHMHALKLELVDANHLIQRWTNYKDGKPEETAVFTFTRSK